MKYGLYSGIFTSVTQRSLKEKKERMDMIKDYYVKNVEFPRFKRIKKQVLPGGELNPGLPRDRRGSLPLYYRGWNDTLLSFVRHCMKKENVDFGESKGSNRQTWTYYTSKRWKLIGRRSHLVKKGSLAWKTKVGEKSLFRSEKWKTAGKSEFVGGTRVRNSRGMFSDARGSISEVFAIFCDFPKT